MIIINFKYIIRNSNTKNVLLLLLG